MIIDTVKNIAVYKDIPSLKKVIEFIETHDMKSLPDGRTDIDGDNLYVMIQHPTLKKPEDGRLEAHDVYADLQYVISGKEVMGYAPRAALGEPTEGSAEKDIFFYDGKAFSSIEMEEDMFAVFFPQDGHAPCIQAAGSQTDTKAVFKIKL